MLSFVTSYGTFTVYSLTVLLNSGEITPSAICMLDKFELSDFFTVFEVLLFEEFPLELLLEVLLLGLGAGVGSGCGVGTTIVTLVEFFTVTSLPVAKSPTVPDAVIVTVPELPAVQVNDLLLFSNHSLAKEPDPPETVALTGPAASLSVTVTVKLSPGDTLLLEAFTLKLAASEVFVSIKVIIPIIPIIIILFKIFLFIVHFPFLLFQCNFSILK